MTSYAIKEKDKKLLQIDSSSIQFEDDKLALESFEFIFNISDNDDKPIIEDEYIKNIFDLIYIRETGIKISTPHVGSNIEVEYPTNENNV